MHRQYFKYILRIPFIIILQYVRGNVCGYVICQFPAVFLLIYSAASSIFSCATDCSGQVIFDGEFHPKTLEALGFGKYRTLNFMLLENANSTIMVSEKSIIFVQLFSHKRKTQTSLIIWILRTEKQRRAHSLLCQSRKPLRPEELKHIHYSLMEGSTNFCFPSCHDFLLNYFYAPQ